MKRNADESGATTFRKKFRFTTLDQLAPFPVKTVPSETNTTFTCIGYFTGLSVEVFEPTMIRQIYENGCYGKGSISRSAPKSCNSTNSMETISLQQFQRRQNWKRKFFPDRSSVGKVLVGIQGAGECVDNPFPVPETLVLFLEEAFFLHDILKCLEIRNINDEPMATDEVLGRFCELSPSFLKNFAAYLYLKKKNWVIKSGLKFGGDFLLYNKGPKYYHASYVVLVLSSTTGEQPKSESITDFKGHFRIAENSSKELLILEVLFPEGVNMCEPRHVIDNLSSIKFVEMCNNRILLNQDKTVGL